MKRVNELKEKSQDINSETQPITATQTVIDKKLNTYCDSQNEENLKEQVAEEKAAAKIFPLNLISSRFKLKDSNVLKGK